VNGPVEEGAENECCGGESRAPLLVGEQQQQAEERDRRPLRVDVRAVERLEGDEAQESGGHEADLTRLELRAQPVDQKDRAQTEQQRNEAGGPLVLAENAKCH
jgi:hypothetical protein